MANPRQRQKQRTSRGKLTKRTGDKLKKVNIKGNAIIAANWDKTQTLQQNYKRLGLVSNPNINASSGGVEKLYPDAPKAVEVDGNGLKANEAIIKRDADGNVAEIIYSSVAAKPESALPETTDVVKALEQRALEEKLTPREASQGELEWLRRIIAKHGGNYEKAARDFKLNPMQQTAANIKKRAIKAGLA
ncbi:Ribosome biogenesis protein Nop16 [Taphrina deformans PYCC 5710]|uniref:Nucleolar protein 16 n=1 Tax=Taphrina deformans (strain PYCC 5710 / ATCC 11124 / CBS 356.35 / IMI 108563 / JCM 9778 / NBRC 8474) TaxID=1097556 RepID=R4XAY7_TAPDE|nr:Ribosome biogenesis protein Nop16 [Taphrina deformans PYCC 5710]|eukprot:CCG82988.1 Ribosome biogenesis protein Nop16 [Taphrina deformans PYCC 5710]